MHPGHESEALVGRSVERVEDDALLAGRGRFADDVAVSASTLHAAILRSPHGHARIASLDASRALALPGVHGVLSGEQVQAWSRPFLVGVRQPMAHWPLAVDRVRYSGEPVAVVVAADRYLAEDALAAIRVDYEPLDVVVDAERSAAPGAPLLHPEVGSNVVSDRSFSYGDPDAAFASAAHRFAIVTRYPRNACTPMECIVVVAEYLGEGDGYDVLSNFQGPFSLQPVMARALGVDGARLRLRSARDSGGSFGVKQAAFPYIVVMCLASRLAGRPVKWVEDRLEHLEAATSASNRVTHLEAAVDEDGRVLALRYDQLDDCGAYLRAPEPASLYRTHGHMTGAYDIRHLAIRNRVVVSNKTPSGLNRGFGGPQVYFPLERMMARIARELALPPQQVIRRNLVPAGAFPYRAAAGALLDSGDYVQALDRAVEDGGLAALEQRRRDARAAGRLYGIGFAAVVEPSISNMGYITTVLTPEERERAGPKDGGTATATVSIDPSGAVHAQVSSVPQGQGHRTVVAQVVADVLGLPLAAVSVTVEHDTRRDPWTISSGNYASRFAGAVAGTVHLAAQRVRARLAAIAARELNVAAEELEFAAGGIRAAGNPDNQVSLRRVAGICHWSPGALAAGESPALRETVFWSMPELAAPDGADRVNSSGCYGFIFDYCAVEVDPVTGQVRIDRYVTMHDAGRRLNPALVDGQIRGGFAHGLGAALYEAFHYGADGGFLSGTFADYLVPTACEVPDPVILHMESPSPFTPLGAKGVGEGNCMSTPVCLANAVADALGLESVDLPMTPGRVAQWIAAGEPPGAAAAGRPGDAGSGHALGHAPSDDAATDDALRGGGSVTLPLAPRALWDALLDPAVLADVLPGCTRLDALPENHYHAELKLGVGPVRGRFEARVRLHDLAPPRAMTLSGSADGPLGSARGHGSLQLAPEGAGTRVGFDYRFQVRGKVAAVGARMLEGAARAVVAQFFKRLVRACERRA